MDGAIQAAASMLIFHCPLAQTYMRFVLPFGRQTAIIANVIYFFYRYISYMIFSCHACDSVRSLMEVSSLYIIHIHVLYASFKHLMIHPSNYSCRLLETVKTKPFISFSSLLTWKEK